MLQTFLPRSMPSTETFMIRPQYVLLLNRNCSWRPLESRRRKYPKVIDRLHDTPTEALGEPRHIAHALEPALPSPDAGRDAVSIARDDERALPDARRRNSHAFKQGRFTAEAIAERREFAALVREMRGLVEQVCARVLYCEEKKPDIKPCCVVPRNRCFDDAGLTLVGSCNRGQSTAFFQDPRHMIIGPLYFLSFPLLRLRARATDRWLSSGEDRKSRLPRRSRDCCKP
jgi:hypothetical protein